MCLEDGVMVKGPGQQLKFSVPAVIHGLCGPKQVAKLNVPTMSG